MSRISSAPDAAIDKPVRLTAACADGTRPAAEDLADPYRDMLLALPTAVYATDAEGRITFFNDAAAALWGRRPTIGEDQWCGSWRLYWPDGRAMTHDECPMAVALRTGEPVRGVEAILERPDGRRIHFVPFPTPVRDARGALRGAVNLLVDITDRKRGDEAMQHLVAIVRSSDDAIISKNLDGVITSWNEGAERLFGYMADEVIGKPVTILIPEERHDEEPNILGRIRRGERIDHYETVRRRKNGSLVHVSLTVSPVKDAHGRIVGASKIARDFSETKQAEARLRKQARRLEILNLIAKLLSQDLDLERIVRAVTDVATELSGAKFGAFFYNSIDERGEACLSYTLSGMERDAFEKFGTPQNNALFDQTFRDRRIIRSDNIAQGERHTFRPGQPEGQLPVRSYLAVPVVSRSGDVLGGLFFGDDQEGIFNQESEDLVVGIAAHAAIAMDNARLHCATRDEIERRKKAEETKELLLNELKHRVKNTLGTVQAIATQTFRNAPREERSAFLARIQSLAAAHDLLTRMDGGKVAVEDIVGRALMPFREKSSPRFTLSGSGGFLPANKAILLAMALHELATNAVKYGALSNATGRVRVAWHVTEGEHGRLHVNWKEEGGPQILPPARRGFGTTLLERAFEGEQGRAQFEFVPEGVVCSLEIAI